MSLLVVTLFLGVVLGGNAIYKLTRTPHRKEAVPFTVPIPADTQPKKIHYSNTHSPYESVSSIFNPLVVENSTTTASPAPQDGSTTPAAHALWSLVGTLIAPAARQSTSTTELLWDGTYTTPAAHATDEPTSTTYQEALHTYGNEVGEVLDAFDLAHTGQLATIQTFLDDRGTTTGILRLANEYKQLSADLTHITAPSPAQQIHADLVAGYQEVGERLAAVPGALTDETLVERMLTYNTSAEKVGSAHVQLITLFAANGITFANYEPGHMFVFAQTNI